MKHKAVLFDLDGTLLNYKQAQKNATDHNESLYRLVNSLEVQGYESRGVPLPESSEMKKVFELHGIEADPAEFLCDYFMKLSKQGILIPGVKGLLKFLKGKVKLAVQNPRLEMAGLAQFFPHRFYSRDMGIAKPDPDILRIAMKTLGVTAEETIFIGDSTTSDEPAAKAAGTDFILFTGDYGEVSRKAGFFL